MFESYVNALLVLCPVSTGIPKVSVIQAEAAAVDEDDEEPTSVEAASGEQTFHI